MSKGKLLDVIHIESRKGPHGGEHWMLTLSCGHLKAARKPRFRDYKIFRPIPFAPQKAKCLLGCEP